MNSFLGFIVGLLQATLSIFGVHSLGQQPIQEPVAIVQPSPVTANTTQSEKTQFCPVLTAAVSKGSKDDTNHPEWAHGDVGALQIFLANHYGLDQKMFVDGIFGANTESYLLKYQKEIGIPQTGKADAATQKAMLSTCTIDAKGVSQTKQNLSFKDASAQVHLKVLEAVQENDAALEQGAARIELLSTDGGIAKLRVTGRVINGIGSEVLNIKSGEKIESDNWPVGFMIEVTSIDASGATLSISELSTD